MALMERVATLLRANLNDLLDRAEDPEKLLKQLVLDMENQLLQLKTQVAVALTDQHLLEKKVREQESQASEWHRRAEFAVGKGDDTLARAALEQAVAQGRTLEAYRAQAAEQLASSESIRSAFNRLQAKLIETQAQCDLLVQQYRHARMVACATEAQVLAAEGQPGGKREPTLRRMQERINLTEAQSKAQQQLAEQRPGALEEQLDSLQQQDAVERMLAELKAKQSRMLAAG